VQSFNGESCLARIRRAGARPTAEFVDRLRACSSTPACAGYRPSSTPACAGYRPWIRNTAPSQNLRRADRHWRRPTPLLKARHREGIHYFESPPGRMIKNGDIRFAISTLLRAAITPYGLAANTSDQNDKPAHCAGLSCAAGQR